MITGASAGIGRATAELFGRRGANVVLLARGSGGLREAASAVEQAGGTTLAIPTDVADFGAVEAAAEQAETTFGPIDVWVNVVFGRPGLVSYAISAVDTALWDLKATLLGVPVSRLLGAARD